MRQSIFHRTVPVPISKMNYVVFELGLVARQSSFDIFLKVKIIKYLNCAVSAMAEFGVVQFLKSDQVARFYARHSH